MRTLGMSLPIFKDGGIVSVRIAVMTKMRTGVIFARLHYIRNSHYSTT